MLDYSPIPSQSSYRRGLFWSALALVVSVFPLIWMGGLVTSHKVGLSVPDWPNSYGYNMFLFPPSKWLGGIFYEHTHRLLGTLSGFLAIALMLMAWGPARTSPARRKWAAATIAFWTLTVVSGVVAGLAAKQHWLGEKVVRLLPHVAVGFGSLALVATLAVFCRDREPRRWARWLTVGLFVAVCFQGLLGGLRVVAVETDLAIIHGCFAQLFFAAAAFTTLATSRWWVNQSATADATARAPESAATDRSKACAVASPKSGTTYLAVATLFAIVCQLVIGATMRHYEAGLAIPGLLVYGKLLPPTDTAALDAINAARAWDAEHLPPTTLVGMWTHFAHRVGAVIVSGLVIALVTTVLRKSGPARASGRTAVILLGLLVTQATLGVLTVYWRKPADVASLHVAVGALTLMTTAVLTAVLARQPAWRTVRHDATAPAGRLATV